MRRRATGFTLIELMITVVIVAILLAVALPAYNKQTQRSKKTAAQAEMLEIANRQEQLLLANRSYADKAALEASGFILDSPVAANYDYTVTVGAGTNPDFLITFTPTGSMTGTSTLTLNAQGVGSPAEDWER